MATLHTHVGRVAVTVATGPDREVTTTITALGHTTSDTDTITVADALWDALGQALGLDREVWRS